jgi:5-methylcytosine-specific restriction endonuclease McrA
VAGAPDPKSRSLARGERRYRRKVASPKQWQAIIAVKGGPCRVCGGKPSSNGHQHLQGTVIEFHHLVSRSRGGDDTPDNIVPLCRACHVLITRGDMPTARLLAASLSDAERAYVESRAAR